MKYRRLITATAGSVVAVSTALLGASVASADDPDPHIPNMQSGYCPGGGMGLPWYGMGAQLAYCDGVLYPDGSYWHIFLYAPGSTYSFYTPIPPAQCVINPDNGPVPQPAPPGGCGGAV